MWDTSRRQATSAQVPARLQATWAELVRRGGLSDQKIKKGTFVRIEKLSFWESLVKIRDIVGTPNLYVHMSSSQSGQPHYVQVVVHCLCD